MNKELNEIIALVQNKQKQRKAELYNKREKTCEECRFFDAYGNKDAGVCTRYPPRIIPGWDDGDFQEDTKILFASKMPHVFAESTACGEFQPVKAKA